MQGVEILLGRQPVYSYVASFELARLVKFAVGNHELVCDRQLLMVSYTIYGEIENIQLPCYYKVAIHTE